MTWCSLFAGVLSVASFCDLASGHGRLIDPPGRSSLWRYKDETRLIRESPQYGKIATNVNDNQLFCGGSQTQLQNEGKCGVCGDNFADRSPRENEAGGKYGLGIITRQYRTGSWINVSVEITAQHKGFFEFRLCKWNRPKKIVTQECLNENLLQTDGGATRYEGIDKSKTYIIKLELPAGLTCSQCVLQWKYKTGNSWGCENEKCGLGYGHQEHFYGCADIAIADDFEAIETQKTSTVPTLSSASTTTKWTPSSNSVTSGISRKTTTTDRAPTSTRSTTTLATPPREGPTIEDCKDKTSDIFYQWDCQKFYKCLPGYLRPVVWSCPPGTAYTGEYCDHSYNVPGCE